MTFSIFLQLCHPHTDFFNFCTTLTTFWQLFNFCMTLSTSCRLFQFLHNINNFSTTFQFSHDINNFLTTFQFFSRLHPLWLTFSISDDFFSFWLTFSTFHSIWPFGPPYEPQSLRKAQNDPRNPNDPKRPHLGPPKGPKKAINVYCIPPPNAPNLDPEEGKLRAGGARKWPKRPLGAPLAAQNSENDPPKTPQNRRQKV